MSLSLKRSAEPTGMYTNITRICIIFTLEHLLFHQHSIILDTGNKLMSLATSTGMRCELCIQLNIANSRLFTSVQAKEIAVQVTY